jgi:hypothetical protein
MTINKIMLIILLCILALPIISCTPGSQTDEFPINRDVAIMIAAANVPSNVIGEASVSTLWDDSNWTVHFSLTENRTVTKNELGWSESPNTKFEHQGMLPVDIYRLLTFTIDRRTGAVLSRQASDSVLLGGPGIFDTEPPERASLPLWSAIASGTGGLVIGGMTVWLIMRRKKITG